MARASLRAKFNQADVNPFDLLSPPERRFAEAYAGEARGNGRKAAEIAGYSGSSSILGTRAYQLLRVPAVQAAINLMLESDPLVCSRVERLRLLSAIARGETRDEVVIAGEVHQVRPSCVARLSAIKTLCTIGGDFREERAEMEDELPKGLSVDDLFDIVGADDDARGLH